MICICIRRKDLVALIDAVVGGQTFRSFVDEREVQDGALSAPKDREIIG